MTWQDIKFTSHPDFNCIDCGLSGEYYFVKNEVWREAGLDEKAHCCLRCLGKRLHRYLSLDDLFVMKDGTPCPSNALAYYPWSTK